MGVLRTDFRARLRAQSANRYGLVSMKTVGGADILATYERTSCERVCALVDEYMEVGDGMAGPSESVERMGGKTHLSLLDVTSGVRCVARYPSSFLPPYSGKTRRWQWGAENESMTCGVGGASVVKGGLRSIVHVWPK